MGNALFIALGLGTVACGAVNRRAMVFAIVLAAGVPITLMTGDTRYFLALGGMNGQAAWLFAIVISCLVALIAYMGRLPHVLAQAPLFLVFLMFALVSLSWSDHLLDGLRMLAKVAAPILVFWVLIGLRPDASAARRLETAIYSTCVIAVILATINTLGGGRLAPLPLEGGLLHLPAFAAPGTSPANFSFLLLVGTIVAYCRFLARRRILHLALAIVFAVAVLLAFVRISLAALLIGLAVVHLARARPVATLLCVIVTVGLAVLLVNSGAFEERMFFAPERVHWAELVTAPEKFLSNVNTSGRTLLWARAARAFEAESPWVGAGIGAVDAWISSGDSLSSELHSEVYRLRLELGWFGLALFVLGLAGLGWRVLRATRRASRSSLTVAQRASGALIPMYVVTLLTDNTLNYAAGFGVLVYGFAAVALVEAARAERAAQSIRAESVVPATDFAAAH